MGNHLTITRIGQRRGMALRRMACLAVTLAVALAGAAAASAAPRPAAPAAAPTFTVNYPADIPADLGDTNYTVCRTAVNNNICTLRAAVMKANRFAGGGATILIPSGAYTLTTAPAGLDDDTTGDLNIYQSMTIVGAGSANTIIDGGGQDRVFNVDFGVRVTLSGLTLRHGHVSGGGGGAILSSGNLTVTDSLITGNSGFGDGGGIRSSEVLHIVRSTISGNNMVAFYGGGYSNDGGTATIDSSVIRDNAPGGLFNYRGTVTVNNSVISGNTGDGGIDNDDGFLTVNNSTISANVNTQYGGGLHNFGLTNITNINNSTFSANSAGFDGGGIYNDRSTLSLFHSTVAGNLADNLAAASYGGGGIFNRVYTGTMVNLYNTLVAENYVSNTVSDCGGNPVTSFNYNYLQSGLGCLAAPGANDLTGGDIWLGPLQDNGGATPTRALLSGLLNGVPTNSPALDQIPVIDCRDSFGVHPVPDQRGVARPINGLCDIGAYEGVQPWFVYGRNLIRNGDAESGGGSPVVSPTVSTSGAFVGAPIWVGITGHFTTYRYDPNQIELQPADLGYNLFSGGDLAADSGAAQYLDVTPAGAAIDEGAVNYNFAADLGGVFDHGNTVSVTATFQDASFTVLGSAALGPVTHTDRADLTGLVHRSATGVLPAGTRNILIAIWMAGDGLAPNNVYADNLSFAVQETGTLYLPAVVR